MISLASLSSIIILGLELVVTRHQVLCREPIVELVVFAVVPEGNSDTENEEASNDDDVNCELSVRLSWRSRRLNWKFSLDPATKAYSSVFIVVNSVVVLQKYIT